MSGGTERAGRETLKLVHFPLPAGLRQTAAWFDVVLAILPSE
jgi:hypothetical protein